MGGKQPRPPALDRSPARWTRRLRRSSSIIMGKGDPNKPRGKMSSYAFFVQTCREEHKKKHPDSSVNFAEFSKKCSERWKVSRGARGPHAGGWP